MRWRRRKPRARMVWRVLPDSNRPGWKVQLPEGDEVAIWTRKQEAVDYARAQAKESYEEAGELTQVVVHKADGTIQTEWTYGEDPVRSPG